MRSTQQLRDAWGPPCEIRRATFAFWNGTEVTVDSRVLPALRRLNDILARHRYAPKVGETWGYNCRKITGGSGYSLHSYGIALDINSRANPYGPRLVTDMPREMVDSIKAIRTTAGLPVWRWGGEFSGSKDAMHFEIVASPAELARGIAGVHSPSVDPEEDEEDMILFLRKNDGGPDLFLPLGNGKAAKITDWAGPQGVEDLIKAGKAKILDIAEVVDL